MRDGLITKKILLERPIKSARQLLYEIPVQVMKDIDRVCWCNRNHLCHGRAWLFEVRRYFTGEKDGTTSDLDANETGQATFAFLETFPGSDRTD